METTVKKISEGCAGLVLLLPLAAQRRRPAAPIKILPNGSLPQATVGDAYAASLGHRGWQSHAAPAFSVSRGVLPAGLSLSAAGVFSGAPAQPVIRRCASPWWTPPTAAADSAPTYCMSCNSTIRPVSPGALTRRPWKMPGAQTVTGWATAISDGDGGTQTLTFAVTNNTNPGLFSAAPTVNASGDLSYTPALNANGSATLPGAAGQRRHGLTAAWTPPRHRPSPSASRP